MSPLNRARPSLHLLLPSDFRMVVLLADVEELSYREIADTLGCPIGTVMSRLHAARLKLRQAADLEELL